MGTRPKPAQDGQLRHAMPQHAQDGQLLLPGLLVDSVHDLAAPDEIKAGHLVLFFGDVLEIMECTFYNRAAFQVAVSA